MIKCCWCGSKSEQGKEIIDPVKSKYIVCEKCYDKVALQHQCIVCGEVSSTLIGGCCLKCLQKSQYIKSKRREEAILGVGEDAYEQAELNDSKFTDEDYERWLLYTKSFSYDDFKNDSQLRRLWIVVKLKSIGIDTDEVTPEQYDDIEKLLAVNSDKIRGRKCILYVPTKSKQRDIIPSKCEPIANYGSAYLFDRPEDVSEEDITQAEEKANDILSKLG